MTPDELLASHSPKVRQLTKRLRRLIKKTVPEASETVYPVWCGIGYRHPHSGYFCGIFPQTEGVKLGFEHGVLLNDPDGFLSGAGKQVRYVVINDVKNIRIASLQRLLLESISVGLQHRRKIPQKTSS